METVDLSGKRFGKLVVVGRSNGNGHANKPLWDCKCDCGRAKTIVVYSLTSGRSTSCGCKLGSGIRFPHGKSDAAEYKIWIGIKQRCGNPKRDAYVSYGGSGVKMCDRWLSGDGQKGGFECFLEDMGERPSPKHQIDRYPNQRGNYEPGNCRWATPVEQANNRTNTRHVIYRGAEMALTDAIRASGSNLYYETVANRLKLGLPIERALTAKKRRELRSATES